MTISTLLRGAALTLCVAPSAARATEADEVLATLRALQRHAEQQGRTIEALQHRIDTLERQALDQDSLAALRAKGAPPDGAARPQAAETAERGAPRPAPAGGVTPGTAQAQALTSTQGIPLFDKKFSFEQGLTYTHYDKRSLVLSGFLALDSILLGQINLQQIKTDQLQYDLTGRWTLSERLSVDLNLPLVYRNSRYFSPGASGSAGTVSDGSNSSTALGDASAGLYYQLAKKEPTDLDWITSIRLKAPTGRHPFGIKLRETAGNDNLVIPARQPSGNGIWSVALGASVLKTYDPVVLFANLGYTYSLARSFADLSSTQNTVAPGDVKMGGGWSLGAGFGLALNDKTSVSFSFAESIQAAARLRASGGPWTRQVGSESNSATLNAGLTHQLSRQLSLVGTLSAGLTPDAPNFSVAVKFPYSF